MSRLSIARSLCDAGTAGALVASFVSLIGIVGVIVNTPALCPDSVSPARCSAAGSKAANLAVVSLIVTGAAGAVILAGQAIDPEA
nr:hypothetical protein [uncultured Mediterranean phage uvMED]